MFVLLIESLKSVKKYHEPAEARSLKEKISLGVPVVAQWKQTQLVSMRMQVQSLAPLSGLRIQRYHELWCRSRHGSDLVWLWLWRRLVAVAPIQPLAQAL